MASFTTCACLLVISVVLLLHQQPTHAARLAYGGRGGLARMGGHKLNRGRTVRYRVDGRQPEKYFADASVVRRGRPTPFTRSHRPFSAFMDTVSVPVMRATGSIGSGGVPPSEPRTVGNFMNRFRNLLISPINRFTSLAL